LTSSTAAISILSKIIGTVLNARPIENYFVNNSFSVERPIFKQS